MLKGLHHAWVYKHKGVYMKQLILTCRQLNIVDHNLYCNTIKLQLCGRCGRGVMVKAAIQQCFNHVEMFYHDQIVSP